MGLVAAVGRAMVSCGLIAAAAVCASVGVGVVRLDAAAVTVVEGQAGAPIVPLGFWRRPPDTKPLLQDWTTGFGTATRARRLIVEEPDAPSNVAQRLVDASRALEVEPTSGRLWLTYTDLLWQMGMPAERIWPALELAGFTARREGEMMLVLSLQVLRLWETASAAQRDRALMTIAEMHRWLSKDRKAAFSDMLKAKPPEVRDEILGGLAERLGKAKGWLKGVG